MGKAACANCEKPLSYPATLTARWCVSDEVALCTKCLELSRAGRQVNLVCPGCSRPTNSINPAGAIFVIAILVVAIIGSITAVASWQSIEYAGITMEPIAGLHSGEMVLVQGEVSGPAGQGVLDGELESCGKSGPCWMWTAVTFPISSGDASAIVEVTGNTKVANAPYYFSNGNSASYRGGDPIAVAGAVELEGGAVEIVAYEVGTLPSTVRAAIQGQLEGLEVILIAVPALVVAYLAVTYGIGGRRLGKSASHAQKFRMRTPTPHPSGADALR